MRKVALSEVKDELSKFPRLAVEEEVVITRHGKPAGILVGFASEDDWFEYRLENDPRFLRRIEEARAGLRAGLGTRLEDVGLEGVKVAERRGREATTPVVRLAGRRPAATPPGTPPATGPGARNQGQRRP